MRHAAALIPLWIRLGVLAPAAVLTLTAVAPTASAGDRVAIPRSHRSLDELSPDRIHHRLRLRAPEADGAWKSHYRKRSVLRYRKDLGDTGMVFRAKAGLKRRNAVKLEILF